MPRWKHKIKPLPSDDKALNAQHFTVYHSKPMPTAAKDDRQAILAFLAAVGSDDDDYLAFKTLRFCYNSWQPREGWPPLTDTSLSKALQAVGCQRRQIDARGRGRGRYVAFRIPSEMGLAA